MKVLDPKVTVGNIEIPIDTNNEDGAGQIIKAWGPTIPVIKINDYVLNISEITEYEFYVSLNSVPGFRLEIDDSSYHIRKSLKNNLVDTAVIFVGNDTWYHKYNGIVTNVISDAGDNNITIYGKVYNPKLYSVIQKSYVDNTVKDIISDVCSTTDMGLFVFEGVDLNNSIDLCINPNDRNIDFFGKVIHDYTGDMWCMDNFYFMHVGNINKIREKPIDTYTIRNGVKFESPQPIVLTSNPYLPEEELNKLIVKYYTVNSNIGDRHISSKETYNVSDDKNVTKTMETLNPIGFGEFHTNTFHGFTKKKFPFYKERVNKDIAGKSITLVMEDVLYEITPFQLVDVEIFLPADGDTKNTTKDIENSGKRVIIGYSISYSKKNADTNFQTIQQKIEVI